jgi:long-chain acyl-CoA synthetase
VVFETVVHKVLKAGAERGNAVAYAARDGERWATTTWAEYTSRVRAAAKGLIALGVEPGQPVCIFGTNQPEWVIFDVAAMAVGAMPAGIYPTNTPEECAYVINHSGSPVVLVQNQERLDRILAKRPEMPGLRHIVLMGNAPAAAPGALTWDQFVAGGRGVPDEALEARLAALGPRDGGTLLYTSGTTGQPKAVVLPHEALSYMAATLIDLIPVGPADRVISYLPLSHIAEQIVTVLTPAVSGHVIYYEPNIKGLAETIKEIRPTAFFAVPRVWEKFYAGVSEVVNEATGLKKVIATKAFAVGRKHVDARSRGKQPGRGLAFQYGLFDRIVFAKAKEKMGFDQTRYMFSAAAPLSPTITHFFAGLGMQILNLYGQSECTGLCSFNRPARNRIGSVGPALPSVELRIADDGEILTRGPNNFLGYLSDPAATAATLDTEGFLHTGDVGHLDDEGFLYITDRKKDIIITAGGENVTPSLIEAELKNSPLIGEVIIIGDERPHLTALISPDAEAVAALGLDAAAVRAGVQAAVDEVNRGVAPVRQIKKFTILDQPLSIEGGELTPTLKVKRKVVRDHFAAAIDAMYQ